MPSKNFDSDSGQASRPSQHSSPQKTDIVTLILEDHRALKRLIKILKNSELEFDQRQVAFDDFAPILVSHAKPEEETLYTYMKSNDELREAAFEGEVEHNIADQLIEEIKRTVDSEMWSARVKVLAELVEHHIEEEESDFLPDFKKNSPAIEREQLGELFLQMKTELLEKGGEDSPHESAQPGQSTKVPFTH